MNAVADGIEAAAASARTGRLVRNFDTPLTTYGRSTCFIRWCSWAAKAVSYTLPQKPQPYLSQHRRTWVEKWDCLHLRWQLGHGRFVDLDPQSDWCVTNDGTAWRTRNRAMVRIADVAPVVDWNATTGFTGAALICGTSSTTTARMVGNFVHMVPNSGSTPSKLSLIRGLKAQLFNFLLNGKVLALVFDSISTLHVRG